MLVKFGPYNEVNSRTGIKLVFDEKALEQIIGKEVYVTFDEDLDNGKRTHILMEKIIGQVSDLTPVHKEDGLYITGEFKQYGKFPFEIKEEPIFNLRSFVSQRDPDRKEVKIMKVLSWDLDISSVKVDGGLENDAINQDTLIEEASIKDNTLIIESYIVNFNKDAKSLEKFVKERNYDTIKQSILELENDNYLQNTFGSGILKMQENIISFIEEFNKISLEKLPPFKNGLGEFIFDLIEERKDNEEYINVVLDIFSTPESISTNIVEFAMAKINEKLEAEEKEKLTLAPTNVFFRIYSNGILCSGINLYFLDVLSKKEKNDPTFIDFKKQLERRIKDENIRVDFLYEYNL